MDAAHHQLGTLALALGLPMVVGLAGTAIVRNRNVQ